MQKLVTTAVQINSDDPALIAELFTPQERAAVLTIANRVKAKCDTLEARIDAQNMDA